MSLRRQFSDSIFKRNPVTVQVLGLCSALAITQSLMPTLIMALAVTCVIGISNLVISLLRYQMLSSLRLILEMIIIAVAVIVADEVIKTFAPEISKVLSVFVGLIVTNCILLGRSENFALHNPPLQSLVDGVGNGVGYSVIIITVAFFRELFGQGSLLGYSVFSLVSDNGWYLPNQFLTLPASAFFIIGTLIWLLSFIFPSSIDETKQ
jgi:Na+-transporting NADH:ubiquinone oxidoreductase subunit D